MNNDLAGGQETRDYLVELYVSRRDGAEVEELAARASAAAAALAREGKSVHYLRSIFVPEDDTCFHLYRAASVAEVREAIARARVQPERIVAAVQVDGNSA